MFMGQGALLLVGVIGGETPKMFGLIKESDSFRLSRRKAFKRVGAQSLRREKSNGKDGHIVHSFATVRFKRAV